MKKPPDTLVKSAPEGTAWFGGEFDRSKVTLRIFGDNLSPDEITKSLGVSPSRSEKKGDVTIGKSSNTQRIAKTGRWSLETNLPDEIDVEIKINNLLDSVTNDSLVWSELSAKYKIDIFCGLFMEAENRGFSLSVSTLRRLASLGIEVGFDIYAPD